MEWYSIVLHIWIVEKEVNLMDELKEYKAELKGIINSLKRIDYFTLTRLPKKYPLINDPSNLADEFHELRGYIQCMIDNEINLLPENEE